LANGQSDGAPGLWGCPVVVDGFGDWYSWASATAKFGAMMGSKRILEKNLRKNASSQLDARYAPFMMRQDRTSLFGHCGFPFFNYGIS